MKYHASLLVIELFLMIQKYGVQALNATKIYDKCTGPGDPGNCTTFIYKWRFEPTANECTTFVWGGCGGNDQNRFNSEAECLYYCIGEPYTLPAYLESTTSLQQTSSLKPTTQTTPTQYHYQSSTKPSIPYELRGSELTFEETGDEKTFMFAKNNTFIQMDGELIQTFQLRLCREISFQFRTRLPHGLLVYHNVKTPEGVELDPYALYVIVEKGQLKVVHVFGKHSTSVTVGEGLNRDEWHSVMVRIDVHGARLIARVDNNQEEIYLKGLNHETNYGVSENLPSVVLVGGLSSEEKLHGVKYIIESFVGCIRNVVLSSGKAASDLLPITPLIATKHENVKEGCTNKCHSRNNLCFMGSRCINHYYGFSCDCFGTRYEGEHCDIYTSTILTLRGSSYVSYRIYDWKDRVHSPMTRISMLFKTHYDDSALFYASGESLKPQYIAASIKNKKAYIEIDFGDGPVSATLGDDLTTHYWYNLTIFHDYNRVLVVLDDHMKEIDLPGPSNHLLFDPEIYFGGGPNLIKKKGLTSKNNFAGVLKNVFFNDVSILYELKKGNPKVHYIGVLEAEFYEVDVEVIPLTFSYPRNHIWWPVEQTDGLNLKFDFKSSKVNAILAYSEVRTSEGQGFWEIRMSPERLSFDLFPDATSGNATHSISVAVKINNPTSWHAIELSYVQGEIKFIVDYEHEKTKLYGLSFDVGDKLIVGSSLRSGAADTGLVGCMRDIEVNGFLIEPRYVVKSERVVGLISLDNCKYIDPCKRPNACEHGAKCSVKEDDTICDCTGTGYFGKNCHFTMYRKTCEELATLGYSKSDVYVIDIDGNGVFPPAHVKCDFQRSLEDGTITIVEHNLPSQVDVRSMNENDFKFDITYRQFSPEMLQELISHSLYCTQYIKYDCFKAPLELHSATWFMSSNNYSTIDFLGKVKRGSCQCAINKTCEDPDLYCNCDSNQSKWLSDEGIFVDPNSLGITQMYFLQQKTLEEDSKGRITLGPLECVETNTQKYVVTFTTSQSYIEVPGWRRGDIAFSFRTTGEKAILLYQPPIRANHPSFMVALTGDHELTFNFTLNTGTQKQVVINSNRKLNGGEWHKIWIDYNEHHVRFMINTDKSMVDLQPEEEFGPFEGSMYIGGATVELLKKSAVKQGLIGCFRGLVVNGEILDIYSYMSVHLSEIIKDCKPSCVPSPCKNGAQCRELWSSFECICNNLWAHIGQFCETNINEKALTFINRESYLKRNYLGEPELQYEKAIMTGILREDLLINLRTYDKHSFVLYANDHQNNFVHLYVTNSNEVVYLFNYNHTIVNLTIAYNELNSGKSIQIAVKRTLTTTTLHVNEMNVTVDKGVLLLDTYSNKPWENPEIEVLSPHRPPAPPTDYFQFNVGGYDVANLLRANQEKDELLGYVGCIRGLKIGENLIDLAELADKNIAHVTTGVLKDCQMKCDLEPCKNGGICMENFTEQESTCNCEHTSFLGEFCNEEKGADFSGESCLQRKFEVTGKIDKVKLQLAFSSLDYRRSNRVMLLLQTSNEPKYYMMVAITIEGFLQFEEDREGAIFGAKVESSFLNNARHSVYYIRNADEAILYIDREEIPLKAIQAPSLPTVNIEANLVEIGGINVIDDKMSIFKSYTGCLSNIFIQINNHTMKPLEEYMLFTKSGIENIKVINQQGVRSAQCNAMFDLKKDIPFIEPTNNTNNALIWEKDPPKREPYYVSYSDLAEKEDKTQVVFITLTAIFVVIIICCIIEVYRNDRAHKRKIERQTDEDIIWAREHASKLHENSSSMKPFNYKPVPLEEKKEPPASHVKPIHGILKNGHMHQPQTITEEAEDNEEELPKDISKMTGITDNELITQPQWDSLIAEESLKIVNEKEKETEEKSNSDNEAEIATENEEKVDSENENEKDEEVDNEMTENPDEISDDDSTFFNQTNIADQTIFEELDDEMFADGFNERPLSLVSVPSESSSITSQRSSVASLLGRIKVSLEEHKSKLSPVFLDADKRQFRNPISYIGGPVIDSKARSSRYPPSNRNSLQSVLSIDP